MIGDKWFSTWVGCSQLLHNGLQLKFIIGAVRSKVHIFLTQTLTYDFLTLGHANCA
jgi:hypothetical protein